MNLPNYTNQLWIKLYILFMIITLGTCLECYVCERQEDNNDKCLNTIMTCEQGEDMCLTEIKWGTMPYWQQGAKKQYYISKKCATRQICSRARTKYMPLCTHIWYEDWQCAECCQGDRCNYFVILSGSTCRSSVLLLSGALLLLFGFYLIERQ